MRPLVVVDLMSHVEPYGGQLVHNHHRYTCPERPLQVVGPLADRATLEGAAGIQVTGSSCMLGEDTPWADRLGEALEAAAAAGVPVLGICFGHQLLAAHFGSTIRSWDRPRIGLADVRFTRQTGPFLPETVPMVHTHRDHVAILGDALEAVAEGGVGGVQAFAHRDLPIWGVQGHPEADAALAALADDFQVSGLPPSELETPAAKALLARFGHQLDQRRP